MKPYVLSTFAEEGFIPAYLAGAMDFCIDQTSRYLCRLAQAFEFLAEHPYAGPESDELQSACGLHLVGSHIVIYTNRPVAICTLRTRHQREDRLSA